APIRSKAEFSEIHESALILESWFSPKHAGYTRKTRDTIEGRFIGSCPNLSGALRSAPSLPPRRPAVRTPREELQKATEEPGEQFPINRGQDPINRPSMVFAVKQVDSKIRADSYLTKLIGEPGEAGPAPAHPGPRGSHSVDAG